MDSRIISFKSRRPNGLRAVTLIELCFAIAIGSLLILVTMSLSMYCGRTFAAMANYLEMENDSRIALNMMSRDMRQARCVTSYTPTKVEFEDYDNTPLAFSYSSATRTLSKIKGSDTTVLLRGCDYLEFSIFQRTPVAGTFGFHLTTNAASCKLIQIHWLCSRTILGTTWNTENVQNAKIVIRKKKSNV